MTGKNLGIAMVLALAIASTGCSTMGNKKVAQAMSNKTPTKPADKPRDDSPKGFVRGIIDSGYISNTKSPSAYLYP